MSHIVRIKARFNSRTPGGVRLVATVATANAHQVSIHAPREGCDVIKSATAYDVLKFQFTHPGRGATKSLKLYPLHFGFQFTHPGRGATNLPSLREWIRACFNSRTPGGVRLTLIRCNYAIACFNSRTPGGVRRVCAFL